MICLNQKLHRNFQLSAKFKLVQRPDVCSLSHLTQKRDFQKYCFGHIQNENIGNPTSYSWDALSSFLYSLPRDKAHHFKWWYHWIMMTQNYHPACTPSFACGILLTTYSSLFIGLCVYLPWSTKLDISLPGLPYFFLWTCDSEHFLEMRCGSCTFARAI